MDIGLYSAVAGRKWWSVYHKIKLHWVLLFGDNLLLHMSHIGAETNSGCLSQGLGSWYPMFLRPVRPLPLKAEQHNSLYSHTFRKQYKEISGHKSDRHSLHLKLHITGGDTMTYLNIYRVDKDFTSKYLQADEQRAKWVWGKPIKRGKWLV